MDGEPITLPDDVIEFLDLIPARVPLLATGQRRLEIEFHHGGFRQARITLASLSKSGLRRVAELPAAPEDA